MENWSDSSIHSNFKISFYLDTNILSYLVDKSFSGLNICFKFLTECHLVELKSSRYVIFEFVGIRKREHFLRKILETTNPDCQKVNLSSLLLYKEGFRSQHVDFKFAMNEIKETILNNELKEIVLDYKIDYESNEIHSGIWKPTFDLLFSSRLSKEDTLVTISSISQSKFEQKDCCYILTNDKDFEKDFSEIEQLTEINNAFQCNNLCKPEIIHIEKLTCNGSTVNLTRKDDDNRSIVLIKEKVIECILKKNQKYFIGNTITVPKKAPANVICFELPSNTILNQNRYLIFIGKYLDFVYTLNVHIDDYRDNMQQLTYPFISQENKRLSFLLNEIQDEQGTKKKVPNEIINKLREPGNWIFIHPDSI